MMKKQIIPKHIIFQSEMHREKIKKNIRDFSKIKLNFC